MLGPEFGGCKFPRAAVCFGRSGRKWRLLKLHVLSTAVSFFSNTSPAAEILTSKLIHYTAVSNSWAAWVSNQKGREFPNPVMAMRYVTTLLA